MAEQPALHLDGVTRRYQQGGAVLEILRGATLSVWPGESVALIAPSGAGKSTLLQIAGLLEYPDGGEVFIGGRATTGMPDAERTAMRRSDIGFIYQFHHLLPEFSALENVMLPQMIYGLDKREAKKRSAELLSFLGLSKRLEHRPAELSGGEQQRVAIARAIAKRPTVLLCDEPTGALDVATGVHVLEAIVTANDKLGTTTLLITHNADIARIGDRVVRFADGHIRSIEANERRIPPSELTW